MFDLQPAPDVLEAGGPGPLPAGKGDAGKRSSASPELFAAALTAQSAEADEQGELVETTVDLVLPFEGADGMPQVLPFEGADGMPQVLPFEGADGMPQVLPFEGADGRPQDGKDVLFPEGENAEASGPSATASLTGASVDLLDADALVGVVAGAVAAEAATASKDTDGKSASPVQQGAASGGTAGNGLPVGGATVDSAGGAPMQDTKTSSSTPTPTLTSDASSATKQTNHVRDAQRPDVPPGQVNDQRSPATVAEGGRGTSVPPATSDIPASPVTVGRPGAEAARPEASGAERVAGQPTVSSPVSDGPVSLAAAPGRPADFDPMSQAAKMEALREQLAAMTGHAPEATATLTTSTMGRTPGHDPADAAQAAVALAQSVKAAMLGEGHDAAAKLLRAAAAPSDSAQPQVVSHGVTPMVRVDVATADGERPQTALPQWAFVPMADGESGSDSTMAFDTSRMELRRYEEVTRLVEHVRAAASASGEGLHTALSARMGELAHDFSAAAARATATSPFTSLEQYELPDQLVRAIRMQWRDGIGEARIRLNPPNLGEVQVALQVRQGAVSAVLTSDSDVVRGWMRSQQHELKAMLASQGLDLDQLVVEEDRQSRHQSDEASEHAPRRPPRRPSSDARFEVRV